jgi:CheY-like chemotaxis protein
MVLNAKQPTESSMNIAVFLVEDNALIRDSLVAALVDLANASVVHVSEGEAEAVRWLNSQQHWDIAVVDLFLKEGSGLGVLSALRTRKPDQLVVVLSNYATGEMHRRCTELGADAVFDNHRVGAVRRVLRHERTRTGRAVVAPLTMAALCAARWPAGWRLRRAPQ